MKERTNQIHKRLKKAFSPQHLDVHDDSQHHQGHAGATPGGETHFSVLIVSQSFEGKTSLARHRAVHKVLSTALQDHIHALSIKALTPEEYHEKVKPES